MDIGSEGVEKEMRKLIKYCVTFVFALLFLAGVPKTTAYASTTTLYTIKTGNTQVYSDTALTRKNGTVSANKELTLLSIKDKYCKISWSADGRKKTGYVARDAVLLSNSITLYTAGKKVKTYIRPNGKEYGYISKDDEVAVLGEKGTAVQVRYPVSRGYKVAFISLQDAAEYVTKTAKTYYVTASAGLIMRKSASSSAAKVTTVPQNSEVTVFKAADGWAYAAYGSKTGFLSTEYLTTDKPQSTKLSYALYHNSDAYISCYFDGYRDQQGRHEGIDIVYRTGEPVYALTSGVVTAVRRGRTGRGGLSTLAIYNSDDNKTVVYLHMSIGNLSVGDEIQTGQKIGTQSWRGISSSSSAHTHVEVREGRKTAAAVSVGDPVLDNKNPEEYWKSKGYTLE